MKSKINCLLIIKKTDINKRVNFLMMSKKENKKLRKIMTKILMNKKKVVEVHQIYQSKLFLMHLKII